ncbi:hypothetical protein RQP53_05215 [Paucibacter sp. APW11]|uniref:Polymerase nucleotidyl transferase domain-containing protein n=1 Tax=Roseateles aquae TaxID=3077235 RepID=A0ABU3PAA3_9BURK|nr:hypothetical protein [Paucibacter sp. APW11]MDT8998666.1 hypothetical protein [Paucibacter sp. APW11]
MLPLTRPRLLEHLHQLVPTIPAVVAAWEGGSAAFDYRDELSDIDAVLVVEDDAVEAVFTAVEQGLQTLSPLALRHDVQGSVGYTQRFYRLEGCSEFLVIDLVLIRRSDPLLFREVELHGQGHTWLDRAGLLVEAHIDPLADRAAARARLAPLRSGFEMFQHIVKKERLRGRAVEALQFYQAMSLRPLVEALRLLHCPARRGFGLRYLARDLPAEVHQRLIPLAFVRDLDDLALKHEAVQAWFAETMALLALDAGDTRLS